MWLFKQTKTKFQNITNIISSTSHKIYNPHFMLNPLYSLIDSILNSEYNIISIDNLESISNQSYSYDQCLVIVEIIMYKINRYKEEKSKIKKLFKIVVITDYLLLNGVSAIIDLLKEQIEIFEELQRNNFQDEKVSKQQLDYMNLIKRKVKHIKQLLNNKEKRMIEKLYLQKAKFKLLELSKQNLLNKHQFKQTYKINKTLSNLKKVETFISQKIENVALSLIGIIDQDIINRINQQNNRQMMERGQSMIDEIQIQQRQNMNPNNQNSQCVCKQQQMFNQKLKNINGRREIRNQNLLQTQTEL